MSAFASLAGQLLVATPDLRDENFNRSVVALIHHDATGASGLVLNRASPTTIGEILAADAEGLATDLPVYIGGPVDGPLMALHQCVSLGERDLLPDVYFSIGRENILGIVAQTLRPFRLFCGYSGWGPHQLEAELEAGGWLLHPATAELVFADEQKLWRALCDQIGWEIMLARSPFAGGEPPDPTSN